jgi:hypothetical protein
MILRICTLQCSQFRLRPAARIARFCSLAPPDYYPVDAKGIVN